TASPASGNTPDRCSPAKAATCRRSRASRRTASFPCHDRQPGRPGARRGGRKSGRGSRAAVTVRSACVLPAPGCDHILVIAERPRRWPGCLPRGACSSAALALLRQQLAASQEQLGPRLGRLVAGVDDEGGDPVAPVVLLALGAAGPDAE